MPELFGARYRYTGMATAKEIGAILAGGIAPFVATLLLSAFNQAWWPIATYMTLLAAISFVTTFFVPETAGRNLHLKEDAM